MLLVKVTGVNQVISRLRKSKGMTGLKIANGLKEGGLLLQRLSQEVVPVKTSNLKGGAFTRNVGGAGVKTDIVVGYVADYAVHVHENLDARHKPGKQAKYLEGPFRKHKGEIMRRIAYVARNF